MPNNEHIDIIDIRNLIEQWKKQNTHFLQILFTDYKIINREYRESINVLKTAKLLDKYTQGLIIDFYLEI